MTMRRYLQREAVGYVASVLGVLGVALILMPFYPNVRGLTAGNSLLIVVLLVALTWGMRPALLGSVLGALYLNYYYVPPLMKFDFHVDSTEDIIGLVAFTVTSITVGRLSSRAQHRAQENQELYDQLRAAFHQSSRLEAIKRSERLKSALLDTVTHDLRTPLTSIKAATTAILDIRKNTSTPSAVVQASEDHLLGIIVQQSDRLNRFIEAMIVLATIEAGGAKKDVETALLEEAIGAAVDRAADTLRNHRVIVECEDDLRAAASTKAIAQVLFSLLENAAKYAPPGTTVRVAAEHYGQRAIQVAVEDAGPGVPAPLREKIFDKFFRGGAEKEHDVQKTGLGLGLAIARGIVEGQGGRIWVEERVAGEGGARFVFTLPAEIEVERSQPEFGVPSR